MGCEENISFDNFPKQSEHVGQQTTVAFKGTTKLLRAEIVRDDMESPFRTILKLKNGNFILASELWNSFNSPTEPETNE